MKTLVLGLGNPILTDDGVGIHVVRALASGGPTGLPLPLGVQVAEASVGGLRLLDVLNGFDRIVLVDAIQTPGGEPGRILRLNVEDVRWTLHSGSTHDLSLPGALALGRGLEMPLPTDDAIAIIAVEVENVLTFGEACTPAVAAAIPRAVDAVLAELAASLRKPGLGGPTDEGTGTCA
jgi:hydrogenase maturation protease